MLARGIHRSGVSIPDPRHGLLNDRALRTVVGLPAYVPPLGILFARAGCPGFPTRSCSKVTMDLLDRYLFSRWLFDLLYAIGVARLLMRHAPVRDRTVGQNGVTGVRGRTPGINGCTGPRVRGFGLRDSWL